MLLGTKARYAVMAMVELAGYEPGMPVTLAQLAEKQEFTVPYLEQIFSKLKQAGLVKSVRGPGGGYVLAAPAASVRISDIVQAVDESLKMTRCANESPQGCMSAGTRCLTHDLWEGLERHIFQYLHGVTLADVLSRGIGGWGNEVVREQDFKQLLTS